MKTATFPSLRVDPALRQAAEDVLQAGESLSGFVEAAVRAQVRQRQEQTAFIARGLAARDRTRDTGIYVSSDEALARLESRLAQAKQKHA
jgi:predicted transcriptional regulator